MPGWNTTCFLHKYLFEILLASDMSSWALQSSATQDTSLSVPSSSIRSTALLLLCAQFVCGLHWSFIFSYPAVFASASTPIMGACLLVLGRIGMLPSKNRRLGFYPLLKCKIRYLHSIYWRARSTPWPMCTMTMNMQGLMPAC